MKPGDYYTDFVARVIAETDPGASASTGGWVEGPDGRRDMDIEVRGTLRGAPYFCLVECKDWGRRVGIQVVDALDSKRRDLRADRAVVYSNSGFSRQAVRKAHRVGIELAAAMSAHDPRIMPRLMNRYIVPAYMPADWMVRLMVPPTHQPPTPFGPEDISFFGHPLQNWIHRVSPDVMVRRHGGVVKREVQFLFAAPQECSVRGTLIPVSGFHLVLEYRRELVYQDAPVAISRGAYETVANFVRLPAGQSVVFGPFKQDGWSPLPKTEAPPMALSEASGTGFSLTFGLTGAVPPHQTPGEPALDGLIDRCTVIADVANDETG